MNSYTHVATFFTHFDAMRFAKALKEQGIAAKQMPVPRRLSSSCGTCVAFTAPPERALQLCGSEVECLFLMDGSDTLLIDHR